MSDDLLALGEFISSADVTSASGATRQTIDQAARASLLCALVGVEREQWIWDFPILAAKGGPKATGAVKLLAGLARTARGWQKVGVKVTRREKSVWKKETR